MNNSHEFNALFQHDMNETSESVQSSAQADWKLNSEHNAKRMLKEILLF